MAYDIPDEIKYKEKIVANLDLKQLGYVVLFGILSFLSYSNIPIEGDIRFIIPSMFLLIGIGFTFLNLEQKIIDRISFITQLRYAGSKSKSAQAFFEINEVSDNLVWLDDGSKIGIFKVQPINFLLLDESRKKVLLLNYRNFLNQLTTPVQILVKTTPVELKDYFEKIERYRTRKELTELYADFRKFEEKKISNKLVKQREYYTVARYRKDQKIEEIEGQLTILKENLLSCGLLCERLGDKELEDFLLDYGGEKSEKGKSESNDEFRNMITTSFRFYPSYGIVNGELHRVVKVSGYPRKVEDGWLQAFLCKNENYDISIHLQPSSIAHTLVYLHNQIIQQTSDLIMSTAKGTPNPSLEIKKADTMRIYDSLYRGEEKLFRVSTYIDNKADDRKELDLLTEKCKSNLNAQMMVPEAVGWRTADSIKSTLPIAKDKLDSNREILTGALAATFPFISAANSNHDGILFAHENHTLNPIFLDFENQSNKHFFVIGISGSGKSYASKYLVIQQLFKDESKLYILDPNGEYSNLCKALGGDIVEISKESKTILNLFDLGGDDFGGKMLQLISAFDIIMGGLNESQKAILSDAISKVYEKKSIKADRDETWTRTPPKFSDLKLVLEEMKEEFHPASPQAKSLDALYRRVKMYCKGNVFGFLDYDTRMRSNNPVICFDLSKLPPPIKPLMIFMVLGFIQRQIRKDKEPKSVLIDEGWVLLRSKEAESYVLEFVKTSRKYNASIGFITQEVEDLLQSSTGKSILNTASVKILMRQNPSNIGMISNNLRLNEYQENYLLSVKKGQGMIITEDNSYCFSIEAPPKMHDLITTDPNEKKLEIKEPKTKKIIKIDLKKGLYIDDDLPGKTAAKLLNNGYEYYQTRITSDDPYIFYLVKVRQNESVEHAFLCWYTLSLIRKNKVKAKMNTTRDPDILVEFKGKRICFEIETGKRLNKMSKKEMKHRFKQKSEDFDNVYLVVSNERVGRRYMSVCNKFITKAELKDLINSLFPSHTIKDAQNA